MRIGIIRIGREKDGDAFGRELAALVDAGYSVAAGTGELVVVRVGDVCGADAGETAKAVFAAARAKLAGRSVVIAVSDEQVRASLASAFADDTAVRVTSEAFASAVMGLEIKEKVSGRATMSASAYHSAAFGGTGVSRTVDAEGYILKILRLCAPGERLGIALVQRKLGLGFPLAAKLFDMMYERGYLKTPDEDARAAESTEAAAEEPAETPEESAEELDSQTAEEGGDALGADAADEAEEEDELPFAEDDDEREDEPEDDVAPEEEEDGAEETDSENCGQEESDEESEEKSDDELEDESEEGPEEELDEEPEEDVPYDSDYVGLFSIDDLDDEDDEEEDDEDEEYGDDEDDDEDEDDESEEYESEDDEDEEEDEEE